MCDICKAVKSQELSIADICRILRRKDDGEYALWRRHLDVIRNKRKEVVAWCKKTNTQYPALEHVKETVEGMTRGRVSRSRGNY
jgi:hypothetical protein